jgi:hypothetical protein
MSEQRDGGPSEHHSFKVEIKELRTDSTTHMVELGNVLFSVTVEGLHVRRAIYLDRGVFFSDKAMYAGRTPSEMLLTLFQTQWLPHVESIMLWAVNHYPQEADAPLEELGK